MSSDSGELDGDRPAGTVRHALRVQFELGFEGSSPCPLQEFDRSPTVLGQQLVDGDCHADVRLADDGDSDAVIHMENVPDEACPCPILAAHGAVPNITRVADDQFRVECYLPDRGTLEPLVEELRSAVERLRLRRLQQLDHAETGSAELTTIDLSVLTEKQREAAVLAVSAGYYETPRQTSLGELADRLDISKSALSQRLTAVESKLAIAAFGSTGR
ncbi:helix-turn-helix domain-containing protein [Halococcus thailandensis]|uniref:Transcription regulator n=1 Tax=Halococcus thailandensis JCM 13552 TaxID=1227457 RepID=M0N8X6_9EURY|nr:helix-turn-helix domain-containing protein [Halococcus thailandensis]EMA53544.1 transcription regulator [Halococcus thailandensis JCM 13552]